MNLLSLILLGASIGIFINIYQKYNTGKFADLLLGALGALEGGYLMYFFFGSSVHLGIVFVSAFLGALGLIGLQRLFGNTKASLTPYSTNYDL